MLSLTENLSYIGQFCDNCVCNLQASGTAERAVQIFGLTVFVISSGVHNPQGVGPATLSRSSRTLNFL